MLYMHLPYSCPNVDAPAAALHETTHLAPPQHVLASQASVPIYIPQFCAQTTPWSYHTRVVAAHHDQRGIESTPSPIRVTKVIHSVAQVFSWSQLLSI